MLSISGPSIALDFRATEYGNNRVDEFVHQGNHAQHRRRRTLLFGADTARFIARANGIVDDEGARHESRRTRPVSVFKHCICASTHGIRALDTILYNERPRPDSEDRTRNWSCRDICSDSRMMPCLPSTFVVVGNRNTFAMQENARKVNK